MILDCPIGIAEYLFNNLARQRRLIGAKPHDEADPLRVTLGGGHLVASGTLDKLI